MSLSDLETATTVVYTHNHYLNVSIFLRGEEKKLLELRRLFGGRIYGDYLLIRGRTLNKSVLLK